MDRAGTLRRATPRCFGYARRLYSEAPPREGPFFCVAYRFLYGRWSLTSLPEGGAEGTEAEGVARVGLLLPSRQAVPPPPKVEVKGRSPECTAGNSFLLLATCDGDEKRTKERRLFKPRLRGAKAGALKPPVWAALVWGDEDEKPNNRTSAIQTGRMAGARSTICANTSHAGSPHPQGACAVYLTPLGKAL